MRWTLTRRVRVVLGFVVVLVIVLLYFNSRRPAARVSVIPVERQAISSSIETNGKVEPITPYALRAQFDGFVDRVPATAGQQVHSGQLLATLDDREIRAQADQVRVQLVSQQAELRTAKGGGRPDEAARITGDLRVAESQRDQLQKQQETLTKLVAEKAATPQEVENNRTALERANTQVEQLRKSKQEFESQVELDRGRLTLAVANSETQLRDLQAKVSSARLVSPINGTLFSLPVHAGDFVHIGDLLADVANLRRVRVRAFIDEPELGQLRPNQMVVVTWSALPGRTWTGQTENVPREVVARGARNVGEVLCSVSNEGMELIPNTTVDVRIDLSGRENVLVIPRGAVQIDHSHDYVYRVEDDRLHRVEIHPGITNPTSIEVVSGLQEGDVVAMPGDIRFKDNMRVSVVTPE